MHILTQIDKASLTNKDVKEYYIKHFLDECTEPESNSILPIRYAYTEFKAWLVRNNVPDFWCAIKDLSQIIKARGYKPTITRICIDDKAVVARVYQGVRLKRT